MLACTRLALHKGKEMSEKVFKPVADAFALIHAGGEPYQWTTNAVEAVAWLKDNPKYSVTEYVTLERYQDAVSDEIAALQQKLYAVLAENVALKNGAEKCYDDITCIHNSYGWSMSEDGESETAVIDLDGAQFVIQETLLNIETPATDALLKAVRAEGIEILTGKLQQLIDEGVFDAKEMGVSAGAIHEGAQIAAQLRAETDTTSSQYESLAGGK